MSHDFLDVVELPRTVVQKYFIFKSIRDKKKQTFFRTRKTEHFNFVLLNFGNYISTVNQPQVATSVCDVESLCTSQMISEVNKQYALRGWEFFSVYLNSLVVILPHHSGTNFARDEPSSPLPNETRREIHDLIDNYAIKLPSSWRTLGISNELRKPFA